MLKPMLKQLRTHGASLTLIAASLLTLAPAAQAARLFCCTDDKGTRACGDVLPEMCRSRAYTEFNERGVKVRAADAPLTVAQQAARDAEDRKKAEEEKLSQEQKRRDQALLATYASESDLDLDKSRKLADLDRGVKQLQERLEGLERNKANLKKQPATPELVEQIRRVAAEATTLQSQIDSKKKDMDQISAKYETDRKRYRELKGLDKPSDAPPPGPAAPATPATAAAPVAAPVAAPAPGNPLPAKK